MPLFYITGYYEQMERLAVWVLALRHMQKTSHVHLCVYVQASMNGTGLTQYG